MRIFSRLVFSLSLALATPVAAISFTPLQGSTTAGLSDVLGARISGDGSFVVGAGLRTLHVPPFPFTVDAPFLFVWRDPGQPEEVSRDVVLRGDVALSADGSTIAAGASDQLTNPIPPSDLFLYQGGAIEQVTENRNLRIRGISGDGQIVVTATSRFDAEVETPLAMEAWEISDDGRTVVGSVGSGLFGRAVVSIDGAAPIELELPPDANAATDAAAFHTTSDGSVIVGAYLDDANMRSVFRWENGASVGLGEYEDALRISGDGSVIIGVQSIWIGLERFVLREFLEGLGLELDDWSGLRATDLSDDGTILLGRGIRNGIRQSWIAVIPEPGTGGLLTLGIALLCARGSVRRHSTVGHLPSLARGGETD